jgi:hypothetical protein
VTIASGLDLGQMSADEIRALPVSDQLKEQLVPYAGLQSQDAVNYLAAHPLSITQDEADTLNRHKLGQMSEIARGNYEGSTGASFDALPREAQTALTSVAYQYPSSTAAPIFWTAVREHRWSDALAELQNFGDRYQSRHNQEAALLQQAITAGQLPR